MPKLSEIIEMFEQFGFEEAHVRQSLALGDSAFNAFEGLKITLQIHWGEMCQELSASRQNELRPIYDRLMSITMKSRVTRKEKVQEEQERASDQFEEFMGRMAACHMQQGQEFFGMVRDRVREMKRRGDWNPEAEARVKAAGLFGDDEEI